MKRPLALIGFTMFIVLAVCFYAFSYFPYVILLLSASLVVTLVIPQIRRSVSPSVFMATALISALIFASTVQFYVLPVRSNCTEEIRKISAVVLDEPEFLYGNYTYKLRVKEINGEDKSLKLLLRSRESIPCSVSDTLKFESVIFEDNYPKSLTNRIFVGAYVNSADDVTVEKATSPSLYYYIVSFREALRTAMYRVFDFDVAALSSAVLLGDKSGLSYDIIMGLRRAGMSHLAVVSGLHLSVITLLFKKTIGKLCRNKYINAAGTVVLVIFFICLTGFGKSTIRSAVMLFMLILAELPNREGDPINTLGFAAIVLCLANPFSAGDIGLMLSFSATFGIVTMGSSMKYALTKGLVPVAYAKHKRLNKALRDCAGVISCTVSAAIATMPVSILFFKKISLVQVFSNFFASSLITFFMLFSVIVLAVYFIPLMNVLTGVFSAISEFFGKGILWIADTFSSLSFAYIYADYAFVWIWLIFSITAFLTGYVLIRKKGIQLMCCLLSFFVLLLGCFGYYSEHKDICTLYIIPSKNGQSIILESFDGNAVLACSDEYSSAYRISQVLEGMVSENSFIIVSSTDNTASKNAWDITQMFDYKSVLMYDTDDNSGYNALLKSHTENYKEMYGNCTLNLWDKANLHISEVNGRVYLYLESCESSVLILPPSGKVSEVPEAMRKADVVVTADYASDMELMDCKKIVLSSIGQTDEFISNVNNGKDIKVVSANDTVIFDIVS